MIQNLAESKMCVLCALVRGWEVKPEVRWFLPIATESDKQNQSERYAARKYGRKCDCILLSPRSEEFPTRTQKEETAENSDIFYYAKMTKKKNYFCTGEIYQKQSEKVNWT